MYVREENIPEENLDWDKHPEKEEDPKIQTDIDTTQNKHVIHLAVEHNKIVLQKAFKFSNLNLKKSILDILDEHGEISLFVAILALPYIIGFVIVTFILIYGGVPINRFFSLKEGIFHFELWSIGAYVSITFGVLWLVSLLILQRR